MKKLFRPVEFGKLVLVSGAAILWTSVQVGDRPALRIHRSFCRALWQNAGAVDRLAVCFAFLAWFPVIVGLQAYCILAYGADVKRRTGKGGLRQAIEQLVLALRHAIPPHAYYSFRFYDDGRRAMALDYLYRFEFKGRKRSIYAFLRKCFSSPETTEALSNKATFALYCEAHQLPVVPVVAVAENGSLRATKAGGDPLPRANLFVKAIRGSGGTDARAWTYRGSGTWQSNDGQVRTLSELTEHLQALSKGKSQVVRLLVGNHGEIANLSAGALSTVRVITCLDEKGCPEVTNALFKMSVNRAAIVDNYHAGGIVAKVDLSTGRLDAALAGTDVWSKHPATGAPIAGRVLPMWNEVLAIARRAHVAFSDHVAVGWDIAILDNGPMLVEGNKSPGLDSIQVTLGEPLGSARFGELLAFHLERAFAQDCKPLGNPLTGTQT